MANLVGRASTPAVGLQTRLLFPISYGWFSVLRVRLSRIRVRAGRRGRRPQDWVRTGDMVDTLDRGHH